VEPPRGIEPRTCSLRAKVVTAITWSKSLVVASLLSVGVRECPSSATPIVTQFVTHSAAKAQWHPALPGRQKRALAPTPEAATDDALVESLGISLPYEVIHAGLRMACTVAYRS
jgi:hypothetical protein